MSEQAQGSNLFQACECFRFDSAVSPELFPIVRHSHFFSEVLLVRSGTLRVVRGSQFQLMKAGELIYFSSLVPHSVDSEGSDPAVFDVVKFNSSSLRELPSYLTALRSIAADAAQLRIPTYMSAEEVRSFHLDSIIEECLKEFSRREFAWDLHVRALLYLLITGLTRFWLNRRKSFADLLNKPHDPILDIPAYIAQHISEPLRVEDLAAQCDMSYPWFAKRFHEYFGLSCKQFIERLRVETVEQYLLYSELTLAEISGLTGYTDCSHMVKDFRRLTGTTPGQFRIRMKTQSAAPFPPFSVQTPANRPPKG